MTRRSPQRRFVRETGSVPAVLLSGRYRLSNEIGRGGMSTVYEATDELLGRRVAVKLLELDEATLPSAKERFHREAQIAASLNHPHIVTIYDTGIDGTTAFIVMELLAGPTLVERVAQKDKLSLPAILNVGKQICQALSAAHSAGVVHRDIKPSNVAYGGNDTVKVLDFGVARMIEATTGQTELTGTSMVIGTASYLSPEQARGDPVSPRTDLYALGCVLFALVTGGPPFRGENALVVCSQHLHKEPPHLSEVAEVPPALSSLVDDLLEKDASRRPADAEVVRSRLASIVVLNDPEEDLTAPLVISDELTSTRQYSPDVTWSAAAPSVQQPPSGPFDSIRVLGSAASKLWARVSLRGRWGVGLAVAMILAITLGVVISNNDTSSTPPSVPVITIPAPSPGASPLPAPLVRTLNDLARSVGS